MEAAMPVDPQERRLLDALVASDLQLSPDLGVERMRQVMDLRTVRRVSDQVIPGPAGDIPIRVYAPPDARSLPVLVYFHGGGWVIGSVQGSDLLCRLLSDWGGCVVVSVDYRLAPEHPFPAAPEDCYAATAWVVAHAARFGGAPTRVAVGGDSAGGNLAAAVTLMARDRGGPDLAFQALLYPVTDYDFDTPSYRANADGHGGGGLTRELMIWFWDQYVPDPADRSHPYAAPLRAVDLRGLPAAWISTAEYDPLCDEGDAYARRLQEAGVAVQHKQHAGMAHGFYGHTAVVDASKDALRDLAWALRDGFVMKPASARKGRQVDRW
jgi:acetyl esterase